MTYKVTISRSPLAVDFDAGSIGEAIGILQQDGTELAKLFELGTALASGTVASDQAGGESATETKRGRKPKDKQPDPSTAKAPDPLPVPGEQTAPPIPPVAGTTDPLAIPAALARDPATNTSPAIPAAAAPPPPPPAPPLAAPTPPLAAPTPPSGVNSGKIIAALEQRANANPATVDAAKTQLAEWLAAYNIVRKGATYDEAVSVIRMQSDEKLSPLLQPLGL